MDAKEAASLGEVARIQAEAHGEAIAFQFEGRSTSFRKFDTHANRIGNALLAEGLKKGTRVCYLGKNSDHYYEALFGAAKAGMVMAPVNWRLAPPEIVYIVNDCRAEILLVGPEFIELARKLAPKLPCVRRIIAMEGGAPEWTGYESWRDAQSDTQPNVAIDWNDVVVQLYTSGTTGRPKGAMIRHSGILGMRRQNPETQAEWNKWSSDDVSLVAMPVFHIGGTGWGITGIVNGAKGVVAREFDPGKVLDFIEKDKISKIFMVPAAMQIVVRNPRAREVDYSRMKYILYGASPIPLDLLRECMEVFGCGFVQMYGMTETTGTIVALPPEDHDPKGNARMRSAGKPLPGVEIA
ncbi:MAG: AMP-binding protein, partial [Proteobacteria bacterium]|nr:AMP-binding protein [Pseudomonadota bacterium]